MKQCEVCWDKYDETKSYQKYCPACGKDPERARRRYAKAEYINKIHAGDVNKVREGSCTECGKKVLTTYGARFCSTACQENHRMKTARCPMCNGLLIEKENYSGRGYCSGECKGAARLAMAKASGDYVPCENCSKMFIRSAYSNRFCCRACYENWRDAQQKPKPQLNPATVRQEQRACEGCGAAFTWSRGNSGQRFCSTACRKQKMKSDKKKETEKLNLGVDMHICAVCRTSQADCERFTSNFIYSPEGANGKIINGKYVITTCPKFKE